VCETNEAQKTSVAIPGTVPFEIFSGKPTGGIDLDNRPSAVDDEEEDSA